MAGKEDPTEDSLAVTPADNKAATDPVPTLDDYSTRDPVKLKRLQEEIEQDEFFQFHAWARDELDKHGRVMVPAGEVSPGQFQEAINEYWYGLLEEYDNGGHSKTEVEAAVPSN